MTCPVDDYAPFVTPSQVNSTVKALESVAYFAIDPAQAPPFWLSDEYTSDPLNLLVLKNGIVDVMAHAEGKNCYFPSTSQLFTHAIGAYDYDPDQREAPHWFGFLDTLGQDDKWIARCNRSWGARLCGGYDLQKIFMMVGPPRCGKGTITRTSLRICWAFRTSAART